jgi:hypothetical protein
MIVKGNMLQNWRKKTIAPPLGPSSFFLQLVNPFLFPHVYLHEICILLLYRKFSIRV